MSKRAEAVLNALVFLAFAIGGLVLVGGALLNGLASVDGPDRCEKAARAEGAFFFDSAGVARTMLTRYRHDRWISAIVVQPYDLDRPPITMVCTFAGTNYANPTNVDWFKGDRVDALKDISTPLEYPTTWFK